MRQTITSTPSTSPIACVNAGASGRPERGDRRRALDGEQRVLVGGVAHLGAADLALLEPAVGGLSVAGVDHEQRVERADAVGDQVVDDAAALVRQQRVLRLAVGEPREVVREQALQELELRRAFDVDLAHVRDVEDAAVAPDGEVLGITPSYWTGMSQPANGTIRAPRATWRSCSGVRRRASSLTARL